MGSPIRAALKVFHPSRPDRVQDPLISKLQVARAWTGLAMTACVLVTYQFLTPEAVARERFIQTGNGFLVMANVFPVAIGGFILVARPPNRRLYLRRTRYPLLALTSWVGTGLILQVLTDDDA